MLILFSFEVIYILKCVILLGGQKVWKEVKFSKGRYSLNLHFLVAFQQLHGWVF